jgi:hypothetical protein
MSAPLRLKEISSVLYHTLPQVLEAPICTEMVETTQADLDRAEERAPAGWPLLLFPYM